MIIPGQSYPSGSSCKSSELRLKTIFDLLYRIVEISAGLIIPCMPAVAVICRNIRPSASRYLSSQKKRLGSFLDMTRATYRQKESASSNELDPSHNEDKSMLNPSRSGVTNEVTFGDTYSNRHVPANASGRAQIYKTTEFEISMQSTDD